MLNVTRPKKDIWYLSLVFIESLQDLVDKMQQEENVCNVRAIHERERRSTVSVKKDRTQECSYGQWEGTL